MNIFYKLFKQDPNSREGVITTTSGIQMLANLFVAAIKIVMGAIAGSIAIVSEGVNNLADAATSVLTLIGSKLATKHPDEKHPFGYGRIEYLTSLVVSMLIVFTGVEMLKSAVDLIFHPEELSVSYLSLVIIALTAVLKFFLGNYTINISKKIDSGSLEAVGKECRSDSYASVITIISSLIYLILGANIDAYAGVIISALIIKAGAEVLIETLNDLIGRPGEKELADELYRIIRNTDGVINAADLMLHSYGPEKYSGSVNIEMDHNKTVEEVYRTIHSLQLKIMHEMGVTMVFGIYAVDNDSKESLKLRTEVAQFVKGYEHALSYHAVFIDKECDKIYCDIVVDYKLGDWDKLEADFHEYMNNLYPGKEVELVIETDYV